MIGYGEFLDLSRSADSAARSQAAFLVSSAYVDHAGPEDERAALFAALISFLEDSSVKVRAALAYGMLRSAKAPRVAILALADDVPIISRAVLQHSPVLIETDLLGLARRIDEDLLPAIVARERVSARLANTLFAREIRTVDLQLLERSEIDIDGERLGLLAEAHADDAVYRGALLKRKALPSHARWLLVQQAASAIRGGRLVQGALMPQRAERLFRDAIDNALCAIGEQAAANREQGFVEAVRGAGAVNTRILMHALLHGHALFFADAIGQLCGVTPAKVFSILGQGARASVNALLARSGMSAGLRNLLTRLVMFARDVDLSGDVAARLFVVTALIEELVIEHDGLLPDELSEGFAYLNEQNLALAREASRGVMPTFVSGEVEDNRFPHSEARVAELMGPDRVALPAA